MNEYLNDLKEVIGELNQDADELYDSLVQNGELSEEKFLTMTAKYIGYKAVANKTLPRAFNSEDINQVKISCGVISQEERYMVLQQAIKDMKTVLGK